ncbi:MULTISPECIES: DMT family transporter [Ramlibacter]|uniref:EamA family transporter n=1 Tax=Ramlibacter pinisoli TaxID=2682844 RepID=A0A6N8IQT2_9BURK|nr:MULTISPECIES: DMT family transporter [Ramlibacter]MBA2964242.1 DMT family transporter [Ramlibacter sp. CGMCC 1.13660]MVQ29208.1 EamA family transporter [Ramlibacter pinisoli]
MAAPLSQPHSVFARPAVVVSLATLCCLLWGSAYPAIKGGYALLQIAPDDLGGKMLFAGWRFLLAGLVLLALAWATGRRLGVRSGRDVGALFALGATQTALQYVFFYIGLSHTTGVKSSILNATGTFFSVLLAHFIYRHERITHRKALGCLVGFAGVLVVNVSPQLARFDVTLLGEGFVVIAAFVLAAASIYGKRLSQRFDAVAMTGAQLAIGGAILLLVGWAAGGSLAHWSWDAAALMAYMVLLSAVAFSLWTILLKHNPVSLVAVFNFLVPVFGAVLSAIFLGESVLEWKNLLALVLVCAGIAMVTRAVGAAARPATVTAPSRAADHP